MKKIAKPNRMSVEHSREELKVIAMNLNNGFDSGQFVSNHKDEFIEWKLIIKRSKQFKS